MVDKEIISTDTISSENIKAKIYTIRGAQVMLDSDLAELYNVETKRINESVKRNPKRFPTEYCFQLTSDEYGKLFLKSQNATSNGRGGRRNLPKVFTEQGVAMLSAVLSSDVAIEVSISIMNAFVSMRHFVADNSQIFQRLDRIELKQIETDNKLERVFKQLEVPRERTGMAFAEGEFYDAVSYIERLFAKANKSIVLIDKYVDRQTLDLLSKKKEGVSVLIIAEKNSCQITDKEFEAFTKQYGKLEIKYSKHFHARYIILDKKELFSVGASVKDVGRQVFDVQQNQEPEVLKTIMNLVKAVYN